MSLKNDEIAYLNRGPSSPMEHRLLSLLGESKQAKAPAKQWKSWLAGLSQKGVKANELSMSGLMSYLDGMGETQVVTKAEVASEAERNMVTIKEIGLGTPYYAAYRYPGGKYKEYLYIANSDRDNVTDEIDAIQWEIDDLNFNMEKVMNEPDLLSRLERRLFGLRHMESKTPDFAQHHYTEAMAGRNGKNLVAHARVSVHGDLYFMDEIQSDWAQKGRRETGAADSSGRRLTAFETGQIPRGPFVQDTEEWAGLVVRRHAALAAANPQIQRFAWITGAMRNGGKIVSSDNLDEFYTRIIPKLLEKVIGKVGGKVTMMPVKLGDKEFQVPGFEMSDAVRQRLQDRQPMFSRTNIDSTIEHSDELKQEVMKQCGEMLGSVARVRILDRLFDIASGQRVAGRYTNKILMLSDEAVDLSYVGNHETFHAAMDLMLNDRERQIVLEKFAPGTALNYQVKDELVSSGDLAAAAQCEIAEEAAAHGFALWRSNRLVITDEPVKGVFGDIVDAMQTLGKWVRKNVFDQGFQTPEEIFDALSDGRLAARREAQLREYHGKHMAR